MKKLKPNEVIMIVLFMIALLVSLVEISKAGVLSADLGFESTLDSLWVIKKGDGAAIDSVKYTSITAFDTVITVDNDTTWQLVCKYWYAGQSNYLSTQFPGQVLPASATISDADMGSIADSIVNRGVGLGAGAYTISILALDTLGGDTAVQGVTMTVTNTTTGVKVGSQSSSATGFTYWNLDSASYEVKGRKTRYTWAYDTVDYTADSTDTLSGYNESVAAASGANTCNVFGTVWNVDGTVAVKARVVFTLTGEAVDTCNDVTVANFSVTDFTDANGLFEQELIYSSCLGGKKYKRKIYYKDGSSEEFKFTVPDQSTYEITGQ